MLERLSKLYKDAYQNKYATIEDLAHDLACDNLLEDPEAFVKGFKEFQGLQIGGKRIERCVCELDSGDGFVQKLHLELGTEFIYIKKFATFFEGEEVE